MKRTIIAIADPSLRDNRGHHFELSKMLTPSSLPGSMDIVWFVNESFKGTHNDVAIYPAFSYTMYDKYFDKSGLAKLNQNIFRIARGVLRKLRLLGVYRHLFPKRHKVNTTDITTPEILSSELLSAIKKSGMGPDDHILFHTSDVPTYWAVFLLFMREDSESFPVVHLSTPYDPETMPNKDVRYPLDLSIAMLDSCGFLGNRVFLHAETRKLAEFLTLYWRHHVDALCLPPPETRVSLHIDESSPLTIAMLGAAREEKGFLLLPDIVRTLWSEYGECRKIRFLIQASPQIVGYSPAIIEAIKQLREFDRDYVQLLEEQLSSEQYYECLASAHIVLLIYDRNKYGVRGSGIATEAVSLGRPILTTCGTFPESLLQTGSGEAASDLSGYINALKKMISNYPEYRLKAMKGSEIYRSIHSAENYLESMIASTRAQHRSSPGKRVLVYTSEPSSLAGACRLLEKSEIFCRLGYTLDIVADDSLVKQVQFPDIFLKFRLVELFGNPELPDLLNLISAQMTGRNGIPLTLLSHLSENPCVAKRLGHVYNIVIVDYKEISTAMEKIFPDAALLQMSPANNSGKAHFLSTSGFIPGRRHSSIIPCTKATILKKSGTRTTRADSTRETLLLPLTFGTTRSDDAWIRHKQGSPAASSILQYDVTLLVSDKFMSVSDFNAVVNRLLRELGCQRKIRIAVINIDTRNTGISGEKISKAEESVLAGSAVVMMLAPHLDENWLYQFLSIYHYVPVVCALTSPKDYKRSLFSDIPFPVFESTGHACSFLKELLDSPESLISESWKIYLKICAIFDIEQYDNAWNEILECIDAGGVTAKKLEHPLQTWAAPFPQVSS